MRPTVNFTEVEVALPVPRHWKGLHNGLLTNLESYYKIQKLTKSRTEFSLVGIETKEGIRTEQSCNNKSTLTVYGITEGVADFREFISNLADKSARVSEALGTWREITSLSKDFKQMTIQEIVKDPKLMLELFEKLRVMPPESKFKLPYRYSKKEREQELIDNLAGIYTIDRSRAHARVVTGTSQEFEPGANLTDDKPIRQFNYALEVAIAPRTDLGQAQAGQITIIGGVTIP